MKCATKAGSLCAVFFAVSISAPACALDLNPAALEKLKTGEPVTAFLPDASESAAGLLEAVIDIPAPAEKVWKILTTCEINLKVFNGLKECKIVSSAPDGKSDVREHVIGWSSLLPKMRNVFTSQYEVPKSITFNRTEGDLKQLKGQWLLEPLPGGAGTRLSYAASIAVGIKVPSMLVKAALEGDMPKTMKAIRKAAMDGAGG